MQKQYQLLWLRKKQPYFGEFLRDDFSVFSLRSSEQTADSSKKPEMLEKIIQGKIAKRMGEMTLLGQAHMAEEGSPVVHKFLEGFGASSNSRVKINDFKLWTLGQ